MSSLTLSPQNISLLTKLWSDDTWVVACLCAEWCDVCKTYRAGFDQLAARHPDKQFVWIDVEDQAEVVGDFDVENFPTLLIQRGDTVAFFGTVLPDAQQANRLIQAQTDKNLPDLIAESLSTPERSALQQNSNLRIRLQEAAAR